MDQHRIVQRVTVVDETGQPIMVGLPFSIVGVGDINVGNAVLSEDWRPKSTSG